MTQNRQIRLFDANINRAKEGLREVEDLFLFANDDYTISKELKLDFEKYNKQYNNITLKTFKNSHDRFLIIDDNELYHIGASLKDAGNKWFAFSKMDIALKNKMISKI